MNSPSDLTLTVYETEDKYGRTGIAKFHPHPDLPELEDFSGADANTMLGQLVDHMVSHNFNGAATVRFETEVDQGKIYRVSVQNLAPKAP